MHALCALDGLAALDAGILLKGLSDPDERVRQHAVQLSEKVSDSKALMEKVLLLASDPSPLVRYQTAFSLGEIHQPKRTKALAEIARRDSGNTWIGAAILSSLTDGAGELFASLASDQSFRSTESSREFLRQLVFLLGARNQSNEVVSALGFCAKTSDQGLGFSLLHALGDGLLRAGSSLDKAGSDSQAIFQRAGTLALNNDSPEAARIEAAQLLGLTTFEHANPTLASLLDLTRPQPVELAAINTLGRFNRPEVGRELIQRWPSFTPRLRSAALSELLARPQRVTALFPARQESRLRPADFSTTLI